MIILKIKVIDEQNVLINFLINLLSCMEEDIESIYNNYFFGENKKTKNSKFDSRKNKQIVKNLIVLFLKESTNTESVGDTGNKSKFNIIKEGEISGSRNPFLKNKDLFKNFVEELDMEDLIVISKIPENDLENFI